MKLIRSGFDGLEFAVKATIPNNFEKSLASLKQRAAEQHGEICAKLHGEWISVRETGARGGYAYSCRHEPTGDWFFKKPNAGDPWGIRFSASSGALVVLGFEGLRLRAMKLLAQLGIDAAIDAYRPSRVDFAVDFLAPEFEVCSRNFIMHSRTSRKSHDIIEEIVENGRSSRTTSVTIGKMPSRQVIVYDKREEVVVKGKSEWALIWGRAMHGPDASELNLTDRATSQIWRVELRTAKRHLKDVWDVNSWASLYEMLPRIFETMLNDIRYQQPDADSNRSRWPDHEIWTQVRAEVRDNLFDEVPTLSPEEYIEIKRKQKLHELEGQILGLTVSTGAIKGVSSSAFRDHWLDMTDRLVNRADDDKRPLTERLDEARMKYTYLVG